VSVWKLGGRRWRARAAAGRLRFVQPPGQVRPVGGALVRGGRRAPLLLFAHGAPRAASPETLIVDAPEAVAPAVGERLSRAIAELRALARMPTFAAAVGEAPAQLEDVLVMLQKGVIGHRRFGLLRNQIAELAALEDEAAGAYDAEIVTKAVQRAAGAWDFTAEHPAVRVGSPARERCVRCGGGAALFCFRSPGVLPVERRQLTCAKCFTVYNLPPWDLDVATAGEIRRQGRSVQGRFRLRNQGRRRQLTFGLQLDGVPAGPRGARVQTIALEPGGAREVVLRFGSREPADNFRRVKVFVASEGAFGYYSFVRFL
jgi:hypothetical protein